jgi:hypothetical protein
MIIVFGVALAAANPSITRRNSLLSPHRFHRLWTVLDGPCCLEGFVRPNALIVRQGGVGLWHAPPPQASQPLPLFQLVA